MDESRLLTDAERHRFARWLRQDAESNDAMAKRLDAEGERWQPLNELAKRKRSLALAQSIVAHHLETTETMTV